jgi:uncharacterized membrane protein
MSKNTKKVETSKKISQDQTQYVTDIDSFWKRYSAETHPRVKIIDWFILYLIAVIALQFFYRIVVGDDFPKNSFLTGMFCPIGVIVLLVSIRSGEKNYRKLAEFFVACLVLFIVSINFIG